MIEDSPKGSFEAALSAGSPILMDGATGTELTRIGRMIGSDDWVASTLGSAEQVSKIHRRYADAGAQIHIANTFATARHVLADVGMEDQFDRINREAVRICREAISDAGAAQNWIAGSISAYVIGSDRSNLPERSQLERNVREQAALLADAGCDLIVLEMLFDAETSIAMMNAAATAGLPISIGLTCVFDKAGEVYLRGENSRRVKPSLRLADALPMIVSVTAAELPWIVTIMHSDLDVTDAALKTVEEHWSGPVGCYPNSGNLIPPDDWDHDSVCSPEDLVAQARLWTDRNVTVIGGCCGIGPKHIRALAEEMA